MTARIRHVRGADWALCRALLPEACGRTDCPIEGFLVLPEQGPRVGGAAVIRFDDRDAWLHLVILPQLRRRGHGSALLAAALEAAGQGGAQRVRAWCDVIAEPSAEPFLEKHGLTAVSRITTYEADFPDSVSTLRKMRDELVARNRVPSNWAVVRLADAPADAVARLFAEYVAQRADLADAPLQLDGDRWKSSIVVLENGRPFAALLVEQHGDAWVVEGRFVERGHQSGLANALLLGAAADLGIDLHARTFQFDSRDDNRDTLKLARRLGAREIRGKVRFERALGTWG